jgi:hypothetical protein
MAAIMTLFQRDNWKVWLLNFAYLTLIPKKDDAISAKDFHPISLIHSFAKLTTKILANRLAPLLDSLVTANQSAFIRGRCIHDNFNLVQQSIKLFHKLNIPSLFLKLDISKAFDTISWPFLFEVLSHVGFGLRWCKLVGNILSSASTRIILNGQLGDQIRHRRGLRQGDPLSPMPFVLTMDVLNSLFCKAGELGLLPPLAQRNHGQRVSLYMDDVALFIKLVEEDMILTLKFSKYLERLRVLRQISRKVVLFPFAVRRWCSLPSATPSIVPWLPFHALTLVFLFPTRNYARLI